MEKIKPIIFSWFIFSGFLLNAGTPEAMALLKANCFSCHNPDKKKGELDLTTREGLLRGGEEGKVVVPGKAAASRLVFFRVSPFRTAICV